MDNYDLLGCTLCMVFICLVFLLVVLFGSLLNNWFKYKDCTNYLNSKERKRDLRNDIIFRSISAFVVFILAFLVHFAMSNIEHRREELFRIEYTGFYNGEEIELENINFDEYDLEYDSEKKEVYLSEKTEYRYIFIPFRFY